MAINKLHEVFIKVKDFDKQVDFYEKLLNCKAKTYKNRWATIQGWLGLYNPEFDIEHGVSLDKTDIDDISIGNNVVVCFSTNDLEKSKEHVRNIGATYVGDIYEVNFIALYRYFHFRDPEGNILEIGKYE